MSLVENKELPSSWEEVPLQNVISQQKGKKPKDLGEITKDRNIPYIDIKAFESGEIRKYCTDEKVVLCEEDDVLIVWDGSRSGLVGFGAKGAVGSTIAKIDSNGMYPKYMFYFLKSKFKYLNTNTRGVGIPHVDPGVFNNLVLAVAPLEQQKRIVAKIEELFSHIDAGIEALNKAKQLLKQYRQSVLKAAVTGELTKQWREENKDKLEPASQLLERILLERRQKWEEQQLEQFKAKGKIPKSDKWKEKYKESQFPEWVGMSELVDGWCWVTIEQLASDQPRSIQSGPFGSNLKHSEFQNEGVLVVGIDNVREGFFSMGSENRISEEKYKELEKYTARPGDVLVTVMATIGRTCVIPEKLEPAIITKHVYRITIDKNLADPEYVNMYLWGAPDAREQFFGQTIGQTRPGLNGGIIRRVCLPLPSIQEQKMILDSVNVKTQAIERMENNIDLQFKKSEKNKQSVLISAFSGELVESKSDDGSALELLELIRKNKIIESLSNNKKKPKITQKKVKKMEKQTLIEVLMESKKELTIDELFELSGRKGLSLDEVEEFYKELKEVVVDKNVSVNPILVKGKKQGDLFSYEADA